MQFGEADQRTSFQGMCHLEKEIEELRRKVGEASGTKREENALYKGKRGFFLGWTKSGARMIRRPGNTSIRELMSDRRFTEAVLGFLKDTKVGRVKEGVVLSSGGP